MPKRWIRVSKNYSVSKPAKIRPSLNPEVSFLFPPEYLGIVHASERLKQLLHLLLYFRFFSPDLLQKVANGEQVLIFYILRVTPDTSNDQKICFPFVDYAQCLDLGDLHRGENGTPK